VALSYEHYLLKLMTTSASIIPAEQTVLRQEFTKNNKFTLQGIGGFSLWW
jgi:hypothetical protein